VDKVGKQWPMLKPLEFWTGIARCQPFRPNCGNAACWSAEFMCGGSTPSQETNAPGRPAPCPKQAEEKRKHDASRRVA
jgi:hypothetical protein